MRYSHAFTIAFSVDSRHAGEDVTAAEIREALERRLCDLDNDELLEAVGLPFDTEELEITNEQRAEWAAEALDRYGIASEGRADYDIPEDMAADLICDLLHLIRAHGCHDPLARLETAKTNYEAEEKGDP